MTDELLNALSIEEMEIEERYKQDRKEFIKRRNAALQEEKFDEASAILFGMYESLQRQGFTKSEAWELMTITLNNTKSI